MNNRERFKAIMHYQPHDRALICDFGFWDETLPTWKTQGLPETVYYEGADTNHVQFFGMDFGMDQIDNATGVNVGLVPTFPEKVIEDQGEHEVIQQADGVRVRRRKFMGSIPMPMGHLLTDRESWRRYYRPRLDPSDDRRFPADWLARAKTWTDPQRETVIALPGGSLYGWLRNWMGVENLSMVVYDDPAWFEEMVTTIADCIIGTLTQILETGGHFDGCSMWEDMCYNAGPLLHPKHFKQFLQPHYRRIADLLHKYGVDVIWVDCDGKIDRLIPLWLEAGINCMFPLEIGTWGADPIRYRQEYGRDLLMLGGFDKHILAQSKTAIKQEINRLAPLVEEGGFIGFCDHRVPPDVPLENYIFYLEMVRQVWGKGIDLKPMMIEPVGV